MAPFGDGVVGGFRSLPRLKPGAGDNAFLDQKTKNAGFGPRSSLTINCQSLLAFRRVRIVAVTVRLLDAPIQSMDHEFRALISADFATEINCILLQIRMDRSTLRAPSLNIPTSIRVRNNMV